MNDIDNSIEQESEPEDSQDVQSHINQDGQLDINAPEEENAINEDEIPSQGDMSVESQEESWVSDETEMKTRGEPSDEEIETSITNEQIEDINQEPLDSLISMDWVVGDDHDEFGEDTGPFTIEDTQPIIVVPDIEQDDETDIESTQPFSPLEFTAPHIVADISSGKQLHEAKEELSEEAFKSISSPPSDIETEKDQHPSRFQPKKQAEPTKKRIVVTSTKSGRFNRGAGCFARMLILSLIGFIALGFMAGVVGLLIYFNIASTLPSVDNLRENAATFETTRILDRNGDVLYEILDPNAGRRTYVSLDEISPYVLATTIATEDKGFYTHVGFDPIAILRSLVLNIRGGETVSGASTITQQLARALLFSREERYERTYYRKVREAILATEITRQYSKDEILELYLNENFYGNFAYGIQAAAETYFQTSADKLTLSQAAFLSGLPQAPSIYDIYTNREATIRRVQDVLVLSYELSGETDCIFVSNNPSKICISSVDAANAYNEIESFEFKQQRVQILYPHWVNYIRAQLEGLYDPQTIFRSGFVVHTTLDPNLQDIAQEIVKEQVDQLASKHVTNGALVAIDPNTSEILVMVGSADFNNEEIHGQVNMAVIPRQPGSSIKPLVYVAAFEKGWTPGTLIWDVKSEFPPSGNPQDTRPPYIPVNYDSRYHGPVTLRSALANSFNVPAVKALDYVGIYDDPSTNENEGFVAFAQRLGVTTLTRDDYGLSLSLGGGEIPLVDMTSSFAVFANGGKAVIPIAITKIVDHTGEVVFEHEGNSNSTVIRPEHAYLISSILSDNVARSPMFGSNSSLNLPFKAAAKTGTTNDYRDNLTIGYVPDLAVGVWVGNADYTPMENTSGLTGAAPIWHDFMIAAAEKHLNNEIRTFSKPSNIIEEFICSISGTKPSKWCPAERVELFASDQPPLPKEDDLWQKLDIDTWTGLLASRECAEYEEDVFALNVGDSWAVRWIKETEKGQAWAKGIGFEKPFFFTPDRTCNTDDPRPLIRITSPYDGEIVRSNEIQIVGEINATHNTFFRYRLEYGEGVDPLVWTQLKTKKTTVERGEKIYTWNVTNIQSGIITLRIYLESTNETYADYQIQIDLQQPTPTPTITPSPTSTSTPLPSATSTPIPTETSTPTLTLTSTPIPTISATMVPTTEVVAPSTTPTP